MTWSSRVRVESRELSSHFESLVCKLESMLSHTKFHVFSTTFFSYEMAPDKIKNSAQHAMKWRPMWWLLFVRAWSLLVVRSIDCCSCLEPSCLSVERLSFTEAWVITALWPKCSCCLVFSYVLCIVWVGCFCRTYDYRHDYFLVSSMLKLSSLKPCKYTRWILASIGRLVTI